jgi:hypothetical protein
MTTNELERICKEVAIVELGVFCMENLSLMIINNSQDSHCSIPDVMLVPLEE